MAEVHDVARADGLVATVGSPHDEMASPRSAPARRLRTCSSASSTRTRRPRVAERSVASASTRSGASRRASSSRSQIASRSPRVTARSLHRLHAVAVNAMLGREVVPLHVQSHADDERVPSCFREEARELAVVDHHVVRPLHTRVDPARLGDGRDRGQARGQRHEVPTLASAVRGAAAPRRAATRPGVRPNCGPSRPRPAVCASATATRPSAAPRVASSTRSRLVESMTSYQRTGPKRVPATARVGPDSGSRRHES